MSDNTCTVYLAKQDGTAICIAKDVNKTQMGKYSFLARVAFKNKAPASDARIVGKNPVVVPAPKTLSVDLESAVKDVLAWIKAQDPARPQHLRLEDIRDTQHGPTFQQSCELYLACNILGIDRDLRGDKVRDDICAYIKSGPLCLNEYQMICEILSFDQGIKVTAINNLLYNFAMHREIPDRQAIYKYACEVGDKEQFDRIDAQMRGKVTAQKAGDKTKGGNGGK